MVESPEGIMLTRWLGGVTRWVAKIWNRLMKSSQSQDQSKTQENSTFLRIKIFDHNIFEIEYGRKHESYSFKTLPELNVSKNIERQKEKSFKMQEASTSDKKTQKEFKDFASLEKAAKNGNVKAQFQLAVNYRLGKGVEKNLEEAFKWCSKAAKQGYVNAQYNLGLSYYRGDGVEKDFTEAIRWYTQAAEQGYADAQFNLGLLYYEGEGEGVEKDPKEAIRWCTKAAEQGNAKAQYTLGTMHYFGQGVLENYKKASQWYTKAVEQGQANAQNNLGSMYYAGEGVEKNISIAYGLYLLGKQGGDPNAKDNLSILKPELTNEQIAEGQNIAQEWQARIDANANKEK